MTYQLPHSDKNQEDSKASPHETDGELERFSFFAAGNNSRKPIQNGTIDQFTAKLINDDGWKLKIENVRSLSGQAQDHAKDELPAITPSVYIKSGERNAANTSFSYTSLIQADFDHHYDPEELISQLKTDPHTRLSFRSVRGKAKAFFKVATVTNSLDHAAAFEAVRLYCKMRGYGEIDNKPKNIISLCYISHDSNALLKDVQPLQWEPLSEPQPVTSPTTEFYGTTQELTDWLANHNIRILGTRDYNPNGTTRLMYLVSCPWESEHTESFGAKDTAVWVDPETGKWAFNCFHDHCEGRGWEDYRSKIAPRDTINPEGHKPYQSLRQPYSKTRARLNRTRAFYR